jgi:hypothetical protein
MMSKVRAVQAVQRLALGMIIVLGFLSILATGGGGGGGNPTFTIGGTVSGLAGSGLVLQNNGGDNLGISGDGAFTFATALADGSAYNVTVLTQPSNPVQKCAVTNASGTLSGANITNVSVDCTNLSGGDQNVTVTCGSDTIAAALANAVPGGRLTITVNGTCTEDVTIERDRVTLKGGTVAGTGAVQPVIQILRARGIVIDNMTVQGGASDGIFATHNADVTITNSTVRNNAQDGVDLRWGAFADISGSTISGNPNCAVVVADGANVLLTDNPLITTDQPSSAICATIGAYRKATVFLNGVNTITNTDTTGPGHVLDILDGSALRATNGVDVITGFIGVSRTANVDLRNATVTGDIGVTRNAWLRVRTPSSVTGNIFIASDSTATFDGTTPPTVNGTVTCGNSFASLVDSATAAVTIGVMGDLARVREGRAEGLIAVGSFSNCHF